MKTKLYSVLRIIIKICLCLSLIVAVGLLLSYVKNLNPLQDGFGVGDLIPRIIYGDDYWTWEKLTDGIYASWSVFTILFCLDKLCDIWERIKSNYGECQH